MFNILHIRDSGDMLGAESVILELAKNSESFNAKSFIGVLGGGSRKLVDIAKQNNLDAFIIPCSGKVDFKTVRFLRAFIKDNNIHIVHPHGYKEDLYAWLSKSTPVVATNHLWKRTTLALKLYAYIDSKILNRFEKIVAVSKPIVNDLADSGVAQSKTVLIPNGIDMQRFSQGLSVEQKNNLRKELNIPAERLVVGMISSLSKEKGHKGAIAGFARVVKNHPTLHLLIVGAGEEDDVLRKQADELNISANITFAGSRRDIPELHAIMDIFLLNSLIEGLPMALLEAMASGKAVIATDVGDVSSAVINNNTGLLISSKNNDELVNALSLLIQDKSKRELLGKNARAHVNKHYSSISMTEKYINLYRELL